MRDRAANYARAREDRSAWFDGAVLLHRRHLSPGQQAAIVASAQDWAKAQPASRPEKAGNVAGLSTVAQRAAESGASDRTQRMADKVAKADPALAVQSEGRQRGPRRRQRHCRRIAGGQASGPRLPRGQSPSRARRGPRTLRAPARGA